MAVPVLIHVFMGLAGFLQLRSVSVGWREAMSAAAQEPLNSALALAASVGLIFVVAFPYRGRTDRFLDAVGVRPLVGGVVVLCFVAGTFLQLPLNEIGNLAQEIWPMAFDQLAYRHRLVNPRTWWGGVSALIALVLVAPVAEELLFRGWLLKDLESDYGTTPALVWTSILFGLVPLEAGAVMYATVAGFALGAVALRTGSTLGSIAMHAGVNALPLLIPTELLRIEGFNTLDAQVQHISLWLLAAALAGLGITLRLLWRATEGPTEDG